jgi:hypothetical protein
MTTVNIYKILFFGLLIIEMTLAIISTLSTTILEHYLPGDITTTSFKIIKEEYHIDFDDNDMKGKAFSRMINDIRNNIPKDKITELSDSEPH